MTGWRRQEKDASGFVGRIRERMWTARRDEEKRAWAAAEVSMAARRLPAMPVFGARDWIECEKVQLALEDAEQLLARPMHVRADVEAGRDDDLEGRRHRGASTRDLERRVQTAARDHAARAWRQHEAVGHGSQCISQPPSTLKVAPVMFFARSEARNATISPRSRGVWNRWSGMRLRK